MADVMRGLSGKAFFCIFLLISMLVTRPPI